MKLIEKLIKSHPWFQMGKSTRSGGEANAVAIRIARAAQKKREAKIKAEDERRRKEYERQEKERREFREEAAKKRAYLNSL